MLSREIHFALPFLVLLVLQTAAVSAQNLPDSKAYAELLKRLQPEPRTDREIGLRLGELLSYTSGPSTFAPDEEMRERASFSYTDDFISVSSWQWINIDDIDSITEQIRSTRTLPQNGRAVLEVDRVVYRSDIEERSREVIYSEFVDGKVVASVDSAWYDNGNYSRHPFREYHYDTDGNLLYDVRRWGMRNDAFSPETADSSHYFYSADMHLIREESYATISGSRSMDSFLFYSTLKSNGLALTDITWGGFFYGTERYEVEDDELLQEAWNFQIAGENLSINTRRIDNGTDPRLRRYSVESHQIGNNYRYSIDTYRYVNALSSSTREQVKHAGVIRPNPLRAGQMFDFDRTFSPDAVYEIMGIDGRVYGSGAVSPSGELWPSIPPGHYHILVTDPLQGVFGYRLVGL